MDPDPAFQGNTDPDPDLIQIQGFDDQKLKKKAENIISLFLYQKLQFTYPQASIKDVQATWKAFSPQKHPSLNKIKFINFFIFVGHFCPSGSGFGSVLRIRIWIQGSYWIRIQSGIRIWIHNTAEQSHTSSVGCRVFLMTEFVFSPCVSAHLLPHLSVPPFRGGGGSQPRQQDDRQEPSHRSHSQHIPHSGNPARSSPGIWDPTKPAVPVIDPVCNRSPLLCFVGSGSCV